MAVASNGLEPPREVATAATDGKQPASFSLGERAFFVGHTGSGKTFLATRFIEDLLPARLPAVVIDPKHMFEPRDKRKWWILEDLPGSWERRIRRQKRPSLLRVVIRPEYMADQTRNEVLNRLYQRIFDAGNCLVYLDEIQALVYNVRANPALSRLVQMGRQRKISVWGSTLRPSAIPRMFLSESDHIFAFRLRDAADRERLSMLLGERAKEPPGPGPHDFWYMPPGTSELDPILVHQDK